mgnify:CR=1 FL=1
MKKNKKIKLLILTIILIFIGGYFSINYVIGKNKLSNLKLLLNKDQRQRVFKYIFREIHCNIVADLLSPPIRLVSIGRKDYGHVPRLEKITYNNKHIYKSDSGMYVHMAYLWSESWTELKSQEKLPPRKQPKRWIPKTC